MPQDLDSDEDTGEEQHSAGRESDEPDSDQPDPFDLRNHVRGIIMLMLVCILLWTLAKYGPGGADWLGNQTKALFGLEPEVATIDPEKPEQEATREKTGQAEEPVIEKEDPPPDIETSGDPRITNAKQTILEALGGPENVVVQHVAISTDEKSMVAAVKLIDRDGNVRLEEIFFEQDDFGRYISTEDSPVEPVIKIWKQE